MYLFHADFRQIAHNIRKRLHQAQNNLAIRLVTEYNGVEQELKRREKINQLKNRVIIEEVKIVTFFEPSGYSIFRTLKQ